MRHSGAILKFYYGAMGCGKTRKLQGDFYSKKEDGFDIIVVKPSIDTKGNNNTLARDGGTVETAFLLKQEDNFYMMIASYLIENNLDFILVDEAQFLTKKQVEELFNIVEIFNISVICYGLKTDFMSNLFEGSKRLFELADESIGIYRQCSCGSNKTFNARVDAEGQFILEGEQVAIDGEAYYKSVCRSCYRKGKVKARTRKIKSEDIEI